MPSTCSDSEQKAGDQMFWLLGERGAHTEAKELRFVVEVTEAATSTTSITRWDDVSETKQVNRGAFD